MRRSIDSVTIPGPRRRAWSLGGLLLALALTAAACGSDATTTAADDATADTSSGTTGEDAAPSDDGDDDAADSGDDDAGGEASADEADAPAGLLALELTDVDGETFTLADYAGTPVLLETFATWCPNCRAQLQQNQEAAAGLGEEAVFVALSTETDLAPGDVAAYADDNGFDDIRFAVLTDEQLAFFADTYGNSAINPPSTPHWFISPDGTIGELITGSTPAGEIPGLLEA